MRPRTLFPLLALLLASACAGGRVSVKPGYDFRRIKSVGVPRFPDARELPESGLIVADMIAQELMMAGLTIVERTQLEKVMAEQRLGATGALSRQGVKRMGRLLGVDAVVIGSVKARIRRERTVVRGTRGRMITTRRGGRFQRVRRRRRLGPGRIKIYESEGDVDLDITAKMVIVETGEVVWIVSAHAEKRSFQSAVDAALRPVLKKVRKQIARALKRKRKRPPPTILEKTGPEIKGWNY